MEITAESLRDQYGYWAEHPDFAPMDWQYEVANGDTRQGYWDWVQGKVEDEGGLLDVVNTKIEELPLMDTSELCTEAKELLSRRLKGKRGGRCKK